MLDEIQKESRKKPLDYEKESEYLNRLIDFKEHKSELGIINLEDSDDMFTKDLYLKIHERFGISKEDALLMANYNEEGIGKLFEVLGRLIDSIIDFISKIFGGGSEKDEKKAATKTKKFTPTDFTDLTDKETAIMIARVGKVFDVEKISLNRLFNRPIAELDRLFNIIKGKPVIYRNDLNKELSDKLTKEHDLPEWIKQETYEIAYVIVGWKVEHNVLKLSVLQEVFVKKSMVYTKKVQVDIAELDNISITADDLKKYIPAFILPTDTRKDLSEQSKRLKRLKNNLIKKESVLKIIKDRYSEEVGIELTEERIASMFGSVLGSVPSSIKSIMTYSRKSTKVILSYVKKKEEEPSQLPNTESFDVNLESIVETPEEKEMLLNIFNLEEDNIKPEAYTKIWNYLKSIAWIDVKTAVDTKLKARLIHDKIGTKTTPLRLNKELAKLHFVWVMSKDYGLNLSDIMIDYQNVCSALANYAFGNPKSVVKTPYSNNLIKLFDKSDLSKISKYNSKTGLYDGQKVSLYMSLVNFNVNILTAKHGRMQYTPTITVMVQVVDSVSGVLLTTQILTKELRKSVVTKDTRDMIVNKILIYLKNDMFTNKKVVGFLKGTANIEKAVNGIKGSLLDDPITAAYMKEGKEIHIGKIAGNIRTGVTAMIGMTKNIVEFNRLKTYFLNEVVRKTLNQTD